MLKRTLKELILLIAIFVMLLFLGNLIASRIGMTVAAILFFVCGELWDLAWWYYRK